MKYNFDEIVDRRHTDSVKWGPMEGDYNVDDILPVWIADMDFKTSPEIIEALGKRVEHGVFGYNYVEDTVYDAIINWVKDRYNWEIKKEWILFTPGVVAGFNLGIKVFTEKNDQIVIQTPAYPPFYRVIDNNEKDLVSNPLIIKDGKYAIDFDDLEKKLRTAKTLMFCSPHNPVGRVWTEEELMKLSKLCEENDVSIISDEIHCDLLFQGHRHINIASLSDYMRDNSITLIAPSKTFNIAGLSTSVAIIPNEEIRDKFSQRFAKSELGHSSLFGVVALEAAYNHSRDWLSEVLKYLEANMEFALEYIEKNIRGIKVIKPEGTHLLWLDCRGLGLEAEELFKLMIEEGKVYLNDGSMFGEEGRGFLRLNIGTARSVIEDALKRIEYAVKQIK
ncbi:MAG: MalY/PatB family protein [Tissierellaceae bacterium]